MQVVAIVGRPNVGKSTLFNKLVGQRLSIVDDKPGVTRDRIYSRCEWLGKEFMLIDTGGIEPKTDDVILAQMREQAMLAVERADAIIFVTDITTGVTANDSDVASMLIKSGKPVVLAVNKVDGVGTPPPERYEFYNLGLGDPIAVSSVHGHGTGDLLEAVFENLPPEEPDEYDADAIKVAVIGKPNVGKSSLVNRLLGQERTMVSNIPGTTRDAIDAAFTGPDGTEYNIIDTAGIRRKRAIEDESLERYSVLRSIAAIRRCDVALLLVDAQEGVTEQDARIAGMIHDEGKAAIVIVNKWDALEKDTGTLEKFRKQVIEDLKFMDYAPVLFLSALTGQRVQTVLPMVNSVWAQASRRVGTGALNDVIGDAQIALQPPMMGGRKLKIYYATQAGVCPPTFALFINAEELMHFSYQRYLENCIRKAFGFEGTPIRFSLREKKKEDVRG